MKKYAVLVAGGSGTRMKSSFPKQFMKLNGIPVICHTVAVFISAFSDLHIVLVLPQIYLEEGRRLIESHFPGLNNISIVEGGETRFHSVKNGLSAVQKDSIIFVHDAVRCLLTENLVHRLYESTLEKGNAVPMILSKDSVRMIGENGNKAIDRNKLALIQTPQVFKGEMLIDAFNADYRDEFTDEASVVEAAGFSINLIPGEENNLKLTQPIDLVVAEKILAQTKPQ
jgi:2-C-methyl-D-erythritol 4-phosphate cytidylyltransferase